MIDGDVLSEIVCGRELIQKCLANNQGFAFIESIMVGIGGVGHDPFVVEGRVDQIDGRGVVGLGNINLIVEGRHHVF